MFVVKTNIPQIKNRFMALKTLASSGGWQGDMVRLLRRANFALKRLTPRSKGAGKGVGYSGHVGDGWTVKVIGKGGKDRIPVLGVVYNKKTHKPTGEPKERAKIKRQYSGGRSGGKKAVVGSFGEYTILEILEYGTRPHKIQPAWAEVLRFKTREGETVFTKEVDHPGTPAHAMVRTTRAKFALWMRNLNRQWAKKIRRTFSK